MSDPRAIPCTVSEAAASTLPSLEAIAATAWTLEPPSPSEMKDLMRDEAGLLVDGLLVRVARGCGALDVVIGEGLASLRVGDRALRLGYSSVGDYAEDRLGINASTADKMARLAIALRDRPVLRAAVWRGEVSARKADAILPVARGIAEEAWVRRAPGETVRALKVAVKAAIGGEPEEDERWERASVGISSEARAKLDEALSLAGKVLGATTPKWQRLEAICCEYLGAHPEADDGGVNGEGLSRETIESLQELKAGLEHEMQKWDFLENVPLVAAPEGNVGPECSPQLIDEELRRLVGLRDEWDEVFGHLAMLLRLTGLWRDMGFVSFAHYCAERLQMAERTVAQRASLARSFYFLPGLRKAMRDGRLSYEKARLVASCADDSTVEDWIRRAEGMTCVALRREIQAAEERQMCARGDLDLCVPARVGTLLAAACRAVRKVEGRWLRPGECLGRLAEHFIETWKEALKERNTVQKRVLARDRWCCQVPGCSRAAAHVHHIIPRSAGGTDDEWNLVSLCAAHHLHGVHMGWVHVSGRAPGALVWELGERALA